MIDAESSSNDESCNKAWESKNAESLENKDRNDDSKTLRGTRLLMEDG